MTTANTLDTNANTLGMNANTFDTHANTLDPVAKTALLTAAMRARESARADALFHDPLAATLAGPSAMAMLETVGEVAAIPVRTRFFDEAIGGAVGDGGPRQLVIVAAGMDTRAYRLGLPDDVTVYELDRPELLDRKGRLSAGVASPTGRRVAVGVDLAADGWEEDLAGAGFRTDAPTCWLVEGLTQYLREPDVHALFDRISALSAPGSHLLTDFVAAELLAAPEARPMLDRMEEWGSAWHYGADDPEALLSERGWKAEVRSFAGVAEALGRRMEGGPGMSGWLVHARR
ncbi:class I SAM-dependent methyltransferase [Streptomyces griseocarneus]|uniref:class I SAM-dependent methyltransferase n=1 Tax=Streptomyces griseocarneus TaxID=51201 RepID=UPI0019907F42|nr:SAM-dependent methyltransferase [Streptomyces griseocarneus]MBZ6473914.1 SAM-dependent methyltransferase [Streptomyces griseocarneus]GHG65883.1 S-adenosyl-L-methionine-dependent methyltransferase [Streptomyces griseocarneus]